MEIPLDLQRRLERRWAARFFRTKRIAVNGGITLTRQQEFTRRVASTGDQLFGLRQEAEALSSDTISDPAENGFVR